jgi:hypothetical protein
MVLDIKEYETHLSQAFKSMDAPLENPVALSRGFKMERGPVIL